MGYREPDAPATPNERRGNASMIFRPPEAAQRVTGNVGPSDTGRSLLGMAIAGGLAEAAGDGTRRAAERGSRALPIEAGGDTQQSAVKAARDGFCAQTRFWIRVSLCKRKAQL